MAAPQTGYHLGHPVYLDVAMMISFLAYLEGGIVTREEATQREAGARERVLKGRAGLRARLPWALDADVGTEGSSQRREEVSLESKSARQHTAASLFNLLYEYLSADDQLVNLTKSSQLEELCPGQLVEMTGEYLGNPLESILAFVAAMYPYLDEQRKAQIATANEAAERIRKAQRSGNPAKRAQAQAALQAQAAVDPGEAISAVVEKLKESENEFGLQMMLKMAEDIKAVPVHDLLFRLRSGLHAVLTVSSEYYSSETNEYLRAGEFKVIGKVTKVITGDTTVNLTRRTVLGVANPSTAQDIVESVETEDIKLDVTDPIVTAPAVQILPMAIFI
jgi:hypothetical protein